MPKNFLHTSIIPLNIREISSLVNDKLNDKSDVFEKVTPSHIKVPSCARKCVPIVGIFTMLLGATFLGFSFVTIPVDHVGYYTPSITCGFECDIQLYNPGTYFALPWSKGSFNIVDVKNKNITVGIINGLYSNKTCVVEYKVQSPIQYVHALTLYSNSITRLEEELIRTLRSIVSTHPITNITKYEKYGLSFYETYYLNA